MGLIYFMSMFINSPVLLVTVLNMLFMLLLILTAIKLKQFKFLLLFIVSLLALSDFYTLLNFYDLIVKIVTFLFYF